MRFMSEKMKKGIKIFVFVGSIVLLITLIPVTLILILFGSSTGSRSMEMPKSPARITEPGKYYLDDNRFIEIVNNVDGLDYMEGVYSNDVFTSNIPFLESYTARKVKSVRLHPGWSIEFTPPDLLLIESGDGEVMERTFNDPLLEFTIVPGSTTITRTPEED